MPHEAAGSAGAGPLVTVIIPTFNRNDLLAQCLDSCLVQRESFDGEFEIVVVDNSPDRRAEPVVTARSGASSVPVHYVSEPRAGISHARNAGFATARGEFIAMIDDDEFAGPTWLRDLLASLRRHGVDGVIGSVKPVFERDESEIPPALGRCFYKNMGKPGSSADRYFSTSNCLVRRSACEGMDPPFSLLRNFSGGEDHMFFNELKRRNCRFVLDSDVSIYENIPSSRVAWSYLLSRNFRKYQILVQNYFDMKPREWTMVLRCMIFGAAQFVIYGLVALWYRLTRSNRAGPMLMRSVGGLGKLLWFPPLQAKPYRR